MKLQLDIQIPNPLEPLIKKYKDTLILNLIIIYATIIVIYGAMLIGLLDKFNDLDRIMEIQKRIGYTAGAWDATNNDVDSVMIYEYNQWKEYNNGNSIK